MKMKKVLSLIMIAALIASVFTVFSLNTAAQDADTADTGANNKLVITCRKQVIGEVEVGSEFIYHVSLNSAGYSIWTGEGQLRYDDSYATIVEHGTKRADGTIDMNAYSFPARLRNTNLITNYFGYKNAALYNYSKYGGTGVFNDDDHFFKVRMKAIAPGTVEIRHYAKSFNSGIDTRLIYDDKGNNQLDPIPYTVCSIEPAAGYVGDANGDWQLNVIDASYIQRISAGEPLTYKAVSADANSDGRIDLLDALNILRYQAGVPTKGRVGEWIFTSEE